MYIKKIYIFFTTLLYTLILTACGGGGGASSPQTQLDQSLLSATFIDSPVYGIDYSCSGSSTIGTTNENGTFDYDVNCGTITFKIGGVILYSKDTSLIPSDKRLYITDLVGVDRTDTNNSKVLELSRFIQSLDDNGNPYDGIKINSDVKIALENSTIDFSTTTPSITDLNNTITNLGKILVSEDDAKAHFTYSLNNDLSLEISGPPPPAPILTSTPTITNQSNITVEVNGQPNTKIFLNGTDLDTTIPITSKISITLSCSGTDGNYDFNISLQDSAHQMSSPKLFTIKKDTTAPNFTSTNIFTVNENSEVAIDINATDNNDLVYSINSNSTDYNDFSINSTDGVITFKDTLDFENPTDENKDNIYKITINVSDGINVVEQNVTINVNNIAEFAPTLTPFSETINENAINGAVIGTISFTSGDSNITSFDLNNSDGTAQNIFTISTTGVITVNDNTTIDYDAGAQSYNLKAIARNSFGESNSVTVTINISNVSDTKPTIANFTGSINENSSAGIIVGNLVISSSDSTISSIVLTDLNDSVTSPEFISSTTGTISVKSGATLDYETKSVYYLKAVATNSSGASNEANVTISLNDLKNETIPSITTFSGSIDENATTGTIIGNITINSTGDSNITSFSIIGTGAGNFDINRSGTITLKAGSLIDYETTSIYQLEAFATNDAGDSAKVNVIISINNISEIVPVLSSTTLYVDQNATTGSVVGQVAIATLGDSNTTIFTLNGTGSNNFDISSSGLITVASGATFNYPSTFTLESNATNNAGWSNTVSITITVRDIPTDLPVLHSLVLNVKEGTPKDTVVGQIEIEAGNTAISSIEFTSALNTHDDAFTISTDGKIRVSGDVNFDFETRPQYQFNVKAFNALGESNEVTVTINISYVSNLYILSAVYDNNKTTLNSNNNPLVNDDTLYLYFSKSVDENTFSANKSEDFNISNGNGAIGSGVVTTYSDNPYHLYIIKGDYSTGSLPFSTGTTKIAIAKNQLTDTDGSYPTDYNATTIEAFKHIIATGQTSSYTTNDDGTYKNGLAKSFSRDNTNNIVFDDTNGLIWEDTASIITVTGSWNDAYNYCNDLAISTYQNWRLPTIQEWLNIIDRSKYEPVLDTTYFQKNASTSSYWSSTIDANNSGNVWRVNIGYGSIGITSKDVTNNTTRYVRCVHEK